VKSWPQSQIQNSLVNGHSTTSSSIRKNRSSYPDHVENVGAAETTSSHKSSLSDAGRNMTVRRTSFHNVRDASFVNGTAPKMDHANNRVKFVGIKAGLSTTTNKGRSSVGWWKLWRCYVVWEFQWRNIWLVCFLEVCCVKVLSSYGVLYLNWKCFTDSRSRHRRRVTTHLEKSGNSKVVREKSGKMEEVRENSG